MVDHPLTGIYLGDQVAEEMCVWMDEYAYCNATIQWKVRPMSFEADYQRYQTKKPCFYPVCRKRLDINTGTALLSLPICHTQREGASLMLVNRPSPSDPEGIYTAHCPAQYNRPKKSLTTHGLILMYSRNLMRYSFIIVLEKADAQRSAYSRSWLCPCS